MARARAASPIRNVPEDHPLATGRPADLTRLRSHYAALRAHMQALMGQPVRDLRCIGDLVDELERVQLQIKAMQGIEGNNPNP